MFSSQPRVKTPNNSAPISMLTTMSSRRKKKPAYATRPHPRLGRKEETGFFLCK